MNERTKQILLIALFALSVIGIGFAIYFFFFRGMIVPSTETKVQTPTTQTGGFPVAKEGTPGVTTEEIPSALPQAAEVASGGVTQTTSLTTGPVYNTTISSDGNKMNYYDKNDGRFYTIDADGNIKKLSDRIFPDVNNVTWNKDSEKAILEFPDSSKIIFDFNSQSQVTLPKHWQDFDFSPTTNDFEAKSIGLDPNNRWLVISDETGSNVTPFQALGDNADKVQVSWSPNNQVVAFSDTASAAGQSSESFDGHIIYPVGKNSENFKSLSVEGFDFKPLWSPDGKTLLYSAYSDYSFSKPLLWIVNGTSSDMGGNRHNIGVNTWADKCSWGSSTELYCAVPQNLPDNAGMQRVLYEDYPDLLYKINIYSGSKQLLAIPENDTTITNISVSKDGTNLFYTNKLTGQLQKIKLK